MMCNFSEKKIQCSSIVKEEVSDFSHLSTFNSSPPLNDCEIDVKTWYSINDLKLLDSSLLLKLFSSVVLLPCGVYRFSCHFNENDCCRTFVEQRESEVEELMRAHLLNHVESLSSNAEKNPSLYQNKRYFPKKVAAIKQEKNDFKNRVSPNESSINALSKNVLPTTSVDNNFSNLEKTVSNTSPLEMKQTRNSSHIVTRLRSGRISKRNFKDNFCEPISESVDLTPASKSTEKLKKRGRPRNVYLPPVHCQASSESNTSSDEDENLHLRIFPDRKHTLSSALRNRFLHLKRRRNFKLSSHLTQCKVKDSAVESTSPHPSESLFKAVQPADSKDDNDETSPLRQCSEKIRTCEEKEVICKDEEIQKEDCLEATERALFGLWNDHCYTLWEGNSVQSTPDDCLDNEKYAVINVDYDKMFSVQPLAPDKAAHTSITEPYHLLGPSSKEIEASKDPNVKAKALRLISELRHRKPKEVMVCTMRKVNGSHSSYVVQDFYSCEICGKKFTAPNSLYGHYRGHAGIKPFRCGVCGQTFTRSHSLSYHTMVHTNTARFKCTYCDRKFRHPTHFKTLSKRIRKESSLEASNSSVSQKLTAARSQTSQQELEEHMNRHTGKEPFKCPDCPRRFRTRNTYRRHAITKHNKVVTPMGDYPAESKVFRRVTWDK